MTSGWDYSGAATAATDNVTLVEGSSFCVSDSAGRIVSSAAQGLFYLDTRILSSWSLVLDGSELEPLDAFVREPHHATFLGRGRPRREGLESTLLVRRERYVGAGLREDLIVSNASPEAAGITLEILADTDFADLFAVKEGRARSREVRIENTRAGVLELVTPDAGSARGVRIRADGAEALPGRLRFQVVVPARGEWSATVEVLASVEGREARSHYPVDQPIEHAAPSRRLREWADRIPVAWSAGAALEKTLSRSAQDLGSLRIFDPEDPSRAAVAAGAPWFMALFGRDSLLTAYMALPIDQDLALGTLHTLARYQGTEVNPLSEEQPGRILHEMRFGEEASLVLGGGNVYYGTVDATPLFVVLLGELARWGAAESDLRHLVPHADRAISWLEEFGDLDGDGFVEYQRSTDRGLRNKGWKDSWDGINFADGRIAEPPIALCEVQGYAYAAYRARAALARQLGEDPVARRCEERAASLKSAFNDRFWLPEQGWFAVGLDRDKRPIDALASNIGHCLWSGIVDDDKAGPVADHLLSEHMFSGWGVRTLADHMGAYNPLSYHNGSVWPHDNALIVSGLMRYGYVEHAQRVAEGVLAAAECFDAQLPELFAGIDRDQFPRPIGYPSSCRPQAWASAAPVQVIRALLRFDPDLPSGLLGLTPALPDSIAELRVQNIPLGASRVTLSVDPTRAEVAGLPDGVVRTAG
ncbi:amylo-alpha-1,6-glucosidase [Marmoricola sp. RAF53]|uniref:amylo-alpha-1,6-glucosidase n=1 Tax=Marmoricola sp. RAF53 TaxID=3233059 RepID=UPI003F96E1C7